MKKGKMRFLRFAAVLTAISLIFYGCGRQAENTKETDSNSKNKTSAENEVSSSGSSSTASTKSEIVLPGKDICISENFTWEDYIKCCRKKRAAIVNLENYFCDYFYNDGKFIMNSGENDNFRYTIYENGTACIDEYVGLDTNIVFPDEIGGYPVMAISKNFGLHYSKAYKKAIILNKDINITFGKNIFFVGNGAFDKCYYKLKKVILNDALIVLSAGTFMFCYDLEEINFPTNLREIGSNAFYNCKKLKEVDLSRTKLRKICAGSFSECYDLTKVILPETISKIDKQAFFYSKNLKTVNIPDSLKMIDETAFNSTQINISMFKEKGIKIGKGMINMSDEDMILNMD